MTRVAIALALVAAPIATGRSFRVHGVGRYVVGVGLDMDGVGLIKDPVAATLQAFEGAWEQLRVLAQEDTASASPSLAGDGAKEAAVKLISNHEAVLRDVTNPGRSPTQPNLVRAGLFDASIVDHALREISTRLLGRQQTDPSALEADQAQVWATTARYLYSRLQATPDEKVGRAPDMSKAAAVAMRGVLEEVAFLASRAADSRVPQPVA